MKKLVCYVLMVLMLFALVGCSGGSGTSDGSVPASLSERNSSSENVVSSPDDVTGSTLEANEPSVSWIGAGTYKVGTDIDAGEYIVMNTSSIMCYIEVTSDSTGDFDSIITNDNITTHTYITVGDGQYLKVQGGEFALAEDVPAFQPVDGMLTEGTYLVGKDLPAGEYKISADEDAVLCYIEVSSSSDGAFSSIVSNDNIEAGTETYVTVSEGQYLKVSDGSILVS